MTSASSAETPHTPYTSLLPDGPDIPPHHPGMNDIYNVGPDKPLGYTPLQTLTNDYHEDTQAVRTLCEQRGLSTVLLNEEDTSIGGDILLVYDEIALSRLLEANRHVLQRADWPTTASDFAKRTTKEFTADPRLYTLIAWAYQDPRPEYQRPPVAAGEQPRLPELPTPSTTWLGRLALRLGLRNKP